jgi:hypothetical protein
MRASFSRATFNGLGRPPLPYSLNLLTDFTHRTSLSPPTYAYLGKMGM